VVSIRISMVSPRSGAASGVGFANMVGWLREDGNEPLAAELLGRCLRQLKYSRNPLE